MMSRSRHQCSPCRQNCNVLPAHSLLPQGLVLLLLLPSLAADLWQTAGEGSLFRALQVAGSAELCWLAWDCFEAAVQHMWLSERLPFST